MIFYDFANKCLNLAAAKVDETFGSGACYLELSTTEPNPDGSNITPPDPTLYPSWERIQLNVTSAMPYADIFGEVANGTVSNSKEFTSRECLEEGGWPELTHFVIYNAKSGGSPLVGGVLRDPDGEIDETTGLYPEKSLTVAQGKVAVFRAGTLQITME